MDRSLAASPSPLLHAVSTSMAAICNLSKLRPVSQVAPVVVLLLALLLPLKRSYAVGQSESTKLYIVYLGDKQHEDADKTTASHLDMLTRIIGSKGEAYGSLIYSYKHGFSGFAAMLTESQAQSIADLPEVLSIKPNTAVPVHTTRSWDFLGLDYNQPTGLLHDAKYGDEVIIGMVDTGIWPESQSFNDDGFGPVPSKWKGVCQVGQAFDSNNCSRKIIGARYYAKHLDSKVFKQEYRSARDIDGHGTHTASTAAGVLVPNASFHGLAAGYARGGAPRARLAIYKACWVRNRVTKLTLCDYAAVTKAIDDAIHDGVDILSLSLGGPSSEYPEALHAVANGITVIFSAGNDGPAPRTVSNASPWLMTVGSATIDRAFPTILTLGNNEKLVGQSLFYERKEKDHWFELYPVMDVRCNQSSLNSTEVAGRIVFCYSPRLVRTMLPFSDLRLAIASAKEASARGLIFAMYTLDVINVVEACDTMACVLIDFEVADRISAYITKASDENTTSVAKVAPASTWIGSEVLAPRISTFSSRGPSPLFPQFLKPDIAAPGSNILAAVKNSYKIMSGTSMACPHVSGVAALLKALHPDWSPAIIKSALVTTASTNSYGLPILADGKPQKIADPFDYGGGFVDPNKAVDPGLAYDVDPNDYMKFFRCGFNISDIGCETPYNLNLPSIAIPNLKTSISVWRTVTNVGQTDAVYKAFFQSPAGVEMTVEPSLLFFNKENKMRSFKVTFKATRKLQGSYMFGSLAWHDGGSHWVRVPIAVRTTIDDLYSEIS